MTQQVSEDCETPEGNHEPMPMAIVVEGVFTDRANMDTFPALLEEIKQSVASRTDVDLTTVHVFIRSAATKVTECVTSIHEESD